MYWFSVVRWSFLLLVLFCQIATAASSIHHKLDVTIEPEKGYLQATDHITLPQATNELSFSLHGSLKLQLKTAGARIISTQKVDGFVPIKQYKIRFASEQNELKIQYSGKIQNRVKYSSGDKKSERENSSGIISGQGVFLSISTLWFPIFDNKPVTFKLTTVLPEGWSSISQGKSIGNNGWEQSSPQDDIYLVAGKYHIYKRPNAVAEAQAYLLHPDKKLADRYLKATEEYLQLYSKLLGPYPYSKFALVENRWQTGYGMPSFTLLGSRVIRLPFILHSSYPHEILHNWWGNGVFVDYSKGNWSEGITSYLADHLIKEQDGRGSGYRRDTLQRYSDYVTENGEYTLEDFRGYHGVSSQAIGYGKTMMLFHMLRLSMGDQRFLDGLRQFYSTNLHKAASYKDIEKAFKQASNRTLATEFKQWTSRTGAPILEITDISVKEHGWDYQLSFTLRQTQKEKPYLLEVPVYIQTEDELEPILKTVTLYDRKATRTIELDDRPLSIRVDPLFDIFRRLDPSEVPSSVGQLFGAENLVVVLPSNSSIQIRQAYRRLANSWKKLSGKIKIVWDNKIEEIPKDSAVWVFGKENLLVDQFIQGMDELPVSLNDQTVRINNKQLVLDENSLVLTNRGAMTIGWLHAHSLDALSGLARKIPHYGKYSYLAFTGNNPDNILKGRWPLNRSSLTVKLDKDAPLKKIIEHKPLSDLIK